MMTARERNKQEVVNAAVEIGQRYNWNPQDLVAIVSYETRGQFGPWQAGPTTQWGQHRGLFQWGEPQQKQYGVTRTMSIAEQMEAGARYLMDRGVKPGDGLLPMYAAVNAGHASKINATDENNGGRPGTVAEKVAGKELRDHIANAKELVSKYVNPSTMNGFSHLSLPNIIDGVTQLSGSGQIATPMQRPDPASVPEYNREASRAAAFSAMPAIQSAPGGIIDTGRTLVDGMDYTRAAADLQPGFDQYEAGRNLSLTMPEIMSVPGGLMDPRLDMPAGSMPASWQSAFDTGRFGQPAPFDGRLERAAGSLPAYTPQFESAKAFDAGRFATYQPPAPNSAEKAYENAVRNSYFENLAANPAPAPTGQNLGISAAIGGAGRPNPPATPPADRTTIASAYVDPRAAAYASMPPAAPAISDSAKLAAAYGAAQYAPAQNVSGQVATGTPAASNIEVPNSARPAPIPALEAPRTVAPRQVTPYTPPEQPAMTPERAKALGMVPTPNVPGAYMPNVAANPAQVARDQAALIAANPLEALGRMVVGALQGGVLYDRLVPNVMQAQGGLFGGGTRNATPTATRDAYSGIRGGVGGSFTGPGGVGGYTGGGFQASPGGFGNYGSDGGFNSGLQSGSGFTYDR